MDKSNNPESWQRSRVSANRASGTFWPRPLTLAVTPVRPLLTRVGEMAASFIWVRISCSSFAQGCYPHGAWCCVQKGWHKHSNYGNVLSFRFSICKAETSLLQDHNCWHTCTQCLSYCASETNTTARRSRSKKQNCATETLQNIN